MSTSTQLIPIYTSRGDMDAYLAYPYLYNKQGEWIGWVSPERKVFSVHGHYVGWLADGPRILRKLVEGYGANRIVIPVPDEMRINPPAHVPLAPMMPELIFGTIDVLLEQPDLLPPVDFGELREDMD
jgi:hypothetical protein